MTTFKPRPIPSGTARQIRALPEPKCNIPIIAMTAHAMAGAKEEYLAAGMDDYISKPIQSALLLSKLAGISKPDAEEPPQSFPDHAMATGVERIGGNEFDEPSPLDVEKLLELEAALSPAQFAGFVSMYLTDFEQILTRIAECHITDSGFEGISRHAHAIVSTAGNLGAMRTSAAARRLEIACRDGQGERCARLIGDLRESCAASSAALQAWCSQRSTEIRVAIAS